MKTIHVDGQIFEFQSEWLVSKIDEWSIYRKGQFKNRKACDVVAVKDDELLLIEVKDYTYPNTFPPSPNDLAETIAQKAWDSMSVLFSLAHTDAHDRGQMDQRELSQKTLKKSLKISLIASVEIPTRSKKIDDGAYLSNLKTQLRKLLRSHLDDIKVDSVSKPVDPERWTHYRNPATRDRHL